MRRALLIGLGLLVLVLVLVVAGVAVLTMTDFGRGHVRRLAVSGVNEAIHGTVTVGELRGGLLDQIILSDVRIADTAGAPFLVADSAAARLDVRSLLSKRIILSDVTLFSPEIHLVKDESGDWNAQRIFPTGDTTVVDSVPAFGDWVRLENVRVVDGTLIVRQPWTPDDTVPGAARDSIIAAALAGETRARVAAVPGGYQHTMSFRRIDALLPLLIVAHPDSEAITLRIDSLRMVAEPLRPPAFDLTHVAGDVRVGDDSVTVRGLVLEMPGTRATGALTYLLEPGDVLLSLRGERLALADLRGLYPPLPESGGGALDLEAAIRESGASDYVVRNARLETDGARVEGAFGLEIGETTMRFHDTDLRFASFPTALVERLAGGGAAIPLRGRFAGRARVAGPLERMRLAAEGTFDPARRAPFRFGAHGTLGVAGEGVFMDALRVEARGVPVALAREFTDSLPPALGGTVDAEATMSGTSTGRIALQFRVRHRDSAAVSVVSGAGSVAPGDRLRTDLALRLEPLSLELAQAFAPGIELRGDVTGTGRVQGTEDSLAARLELALPEGGAIVDGRVAGLRDTLTYDARLELRGVGVQAMAPRSLPAMLSGTAHVVGTGFAPATMVARVTADVRALTVDSARFDRATLAATARGGRLTVDSLRVRAPFGIAEARGDFGLVERESGRLAFRVRVDSLAGLQRWIGTGDTTMIAPRPRAVRRLEQLAARADSARRAQWLERPDLADVAARGYPWERGAPPNRADAAGLPRDSIFGAVEVTGEVRGWIERFDGSAVATSDGIIWGGNHLGATHAEVAWRDAPGDSATITARVGVDSVRMSGFAFDSTHLRGRYRAGEGEVQLAVYPGDTSEYRAHVEYALRTDEGEVRLRELALRIDTTTWTATHPSRVRWRGQGIAIDSLELRTTRGGGRIFAHGELPGDGTGNLALRIDSLEISPWLTLAQSNTPATGLVTFAGGIEGSARAPRMSGALALSNVIYNAVPFPDLRTEFRYAERALTFSGGLARGAERQLARFDGALPIDLSYGDSVARRLLDGPIRVDVSGDSIALAPLAELTDAITRIDGSLRGVLQVRGTYERPHLVGEMSADVPVLAVAPLGVTFTDAVARVRARGDTLLIDTLVARSGGTLEAAGAVAIANFERPSFDLRVVARDARVLDNAIGQLDVDTRLDLNGPLDTLAVKGTVTINRGTVNIPSPEERTLIATDDPAILSVVDTALAEELDVAPSPPVMENLRADVEVTVGRGVWARSPEANVEVYGDLRVSRDSVSRALALAGALYADQGDYTLYGRRFVVTQGAVRFAGGPEINPVLQLMATYEVRQAGRAPFDIRVVIGGTLEDPKVALESNAQPTLSESDLISFLAFGRSSTSLLEFQGSGLEGGGQSGSSLAGNVASLATRQLASIALGALADEARQDLTRATRADVVNITPAALPADLSLGAFGALLRGTEVQLGRYFASRTFVSADIRPTLAVPGAMVEHWLNSTTRFRASFETRYQPQPPTLSRGIRPETRGVLGGLVTWRIRW